MKEDRMAKEPTSITTSSTLVEELVERSPFSWLQLTVAVGLGLILFLVGTTYLDGLLTTRPLDTVLWRNLMQAPALIVYLLAIQPILRRLRDSAIEAFRPLVPINDDDYHQVVADAPIFNRRWESLALGLGVGGFVVETYLLVMTAVFLFLAMGVTESFPGPGKEPGSGGEALFVGLFFGAILVIEKWWSIHHCRRLVRRLIPVE